MSYRPELMKELIDSQVKDIEETKKYISELMSLVGNSSIKQQMGAGFEEYAAVAAVVNRKLSFRETVMSDTGCDMKTYFLSIKKAVIRLGIEESDIDLSATKREALLEKYISEHPEYMDTLKEIIAEEDDN